MKAQISIELEEELLSALDRIALSETRTREALIRSAIVSYLERLTQMEELKSLAMDRYLEGELNFDDFARIVGYERAVLARDIDQAMKESIKHASEDFARGTLTPEERTELSDLVAQYEQMMLLNSEALLRGTHPQFFDESGRLVQSRLNQAIRIRHPGQRTSGLEAEELS